MGSTILVWVVASRSQLHRVVSIIGCRYLVVGAATGGWPPQPVAVIWSLWFSISGVLLLPRVVGTGPAAATTGRLALEADASRASCQLGHFRPQTTSPTARFADRAGRGDADVARVSPFGRFRPTSTISNGQTGRDGSARFSPGSSGRDHTALGPVPDPPNGSKTPASRTWVTRSPFLSVRILGGDVEKSRPAPSLGCNAAVRPTSHKERTPWPSTCC